MTEEQIQEQYTGIKLEFDFDDPPQKVWRAISIPELRKRWPVTRPPKSRPPSSFPEKSFAAGCAISTGHILKHCQLRHRSKRDGRDAPADHSPGERHQTERPLEC